VLAVSELHVYDEATAHSAAMNMAIDEALLETASAPSLRFYGWQRPSISFGYFGLFADVAPEQATRDIVRRWTGGGIVHHGEDLTYAIVLPSNGAAPGRWSREIYADIHEAIRRALSGHVTVALAREDAPKISDACFANPVVADVLVDGRKIAGAAQRRARVGLLHQGSIQFQSLPPNFREAFAAALCPAFVRRDFAPGLLKRAAVLAQQKYSRPEWTRRR
jgi:lipoate-protein ligase A